MSTNLKEKIPRCWSILKWLILVAALWYLWSEGMVTRASLTLSSKAMTGIPAAVMCLALSVAAVSGRYHVLLRCLRVPSDIGTQLGIGFSGVLVQQFGSELGFDAMRGLASKARGGKGTDVLAALMVDRLLGTTALTIIAAFGLSWLWRDGWYFVAGAMMVCLFSVPLVLIGVARIHEANSRGWWQRLPGMGMVASVGVSARAYKGHWLLLVILLCVSLVSHLCVFIALYLCGMSLVGSALAFSEAIAGGAVSTFTSALPLPLSGLGVGETAFGETVSLMRGIDAVGGFAAVFLLQRLLLLAMGVVSWLWITVSKSV